MRDIFIAMVACSCYYMLKSNASFIKSRIWILYFGLFSVALYFFLSVVSYSIKTPQIWDFTAFYLYGKVGAEGYNFYLPESLQLVFNSANFPFTDYRGLVEEVVNVGFPYPPPTMFYFLPLGFLPYKVALIVWSVFNLIFAFGSIYLIYSMYFNSDNLNGFLLVGILFFVSSQVQFTIICTQTNFILLFLLLLMRKYSDNKYAGILLALAVFTKPYMIIFGLFFLLTKKWKTIIYFISSSSIMLGISLLVFGKDVFLSYFFNNPVSRVPINVFSEDVNNSLQAVLLRNNLISVENPQIYAFIAIVVIIVTIIFSMILIKRKLFDYIWAILLLVGLIIYPGTLSYYAVLLMFIVFQFFNEKEQLGFHVYLNIPIIGIFFYLTSVSVFKSMIFLLIIILLKLFWPIINSAKDSSKSLAEVG